MGRRPRHRRRLRAPVRAAHARAPVRRRAAAARPLCPRARAGDRVMRPLGVAATGAVLALCACGGSSEDAPARSEPATAPQTAQAAAGRLRLVGVGSFDQPLFVTAPPGDRRRVFVVEKGGTIRVVRGGRRRPQPFLDLRGKVSTGSEQGLLSMAFAPDYARSGRFYVDYTDTSGNSHVVEYRRATADRANAGSAREILSQQQPESNHNGGQLEFGPDKLLYIGFGDGGGGDDQHGSRGNAQDLGTWLGKLLRIDPRAGGGRPYRVPSSNPFAKRSGAKPEIYSYGLRNPWRFSFDRRTGAITIGDVGQDTREEVDYARRGGARGANFGWRPFDGDRRNFHAPAAGERRRGPPAAPPRSRRRARAARPSTTAAPTAAARSRAATSSATAACRRSTAATSTATSAPGACTPSGCPRAAAAAGRCRCRGSRACPRSARTRGGASTRRR